MINCSLEMKTVATAPQSAKAAPVTVYRPDANGELKVVRVIDNPTVAGAATLSQYNRKMLKTFSITREENGERVYICSVDGRKNAIAKCQYLRSLNPDWNDIDMHEPLGESSDE